MDRKQAYRIFLSSPLWLAIRQKKLAVNPCCQRCNYSKGLQCHHRNYPAKWEDTKNDDLETLCAACHRKEHGINGRPKKLSKSEKNIRRAIRGIMRAKAERMNRYR